jgi:uncharacterized membrane protein YeaQ/YmgE (transglycosylase-associated protein family)
MGVIAWIVLGLGAGLLANVLILGRRSQGLISTCLISVAGAVLGGWIAAKAFHVVTLHGFFNLSTWLAAIAGAAVLLLTYHLPGQPPQPVRAVGAPVNGQVPPAAGRVPGTCIAADPARPRAAGAQHRADLDERP